MIPPSILRDPVLTLDPIHWPSPDTIQELRAGKVAALGTYGEQSAIAKKRVPGPLFASSTGFTVDRHFYHEHGGTERALNQYDPLHYPDWREERPNAAQIFQPGGFGENLVGSGALSETNVCVGDVFRIGDAAGPKESDVRIEVSEPRNPCYKLNIRFQSPTAQRRVVKTGRTGWNYRVLREGEVREGMVIALVERPHPRWSVRNIQRVLHGRVVEPSLVEEVAELGVVTDFVRNLANKRLATASRRYKLVEAEMVTPRVRRLTFELAIPAKMKDPKFKPFANAQIKFGPNGTLSRSYSIVSGDLVRFSLGVALDDHSRGGSKYIHESLKVGDEIKMAPGLDLANAENETLCEQESIEQRIVIIGGIGVTAFLPAIKQWTEQNLPFEIHYAVRSEADAAFLAALPAAQTTLYAKSRNERLRVDEVIPAPRPDGTFPARIFCCGPDRLMDAAKDRVAALGYPAHRLHFESFGAAGAAQLGPAFDIDVAEPDTGRTATLRVPEDKTLLQILTDAGFDVNSACQAGGCGSCKVAVTCGGKRVKHKTELLKGEEIEGAMLSCVDRAEGRIAVEVD